jgi:hypothetical protein
MLSSDHGHTILVAEQRHTDERLQADFTTIRLPAIRLAKLKRIWPVLCSLVVLCKTMQRLRTHPTRRWCADETLQEIVKINSFTSEPW